ncbi:MAG: cation:proton antiporter [Thermonemataceae bacterium]
MELFTTFTILIVLSATFAYINERYLKFPRTIGIMIVSLITSLVIIGLASPIPAIYEESTALVGSLNFSKVVMEVLLSFLLFAGALHVDTRTLASEQKPILAFATIGLLISTFLVGTLVYFMFQLLSYPVDYIYCLLFGSLISPTDPIAVLSILKNARVPKQLEVKITGESLFNDGIAVVVFLSLFEMARLGIGEVSTLDIALLFLKEAGGGIVLGIALGYAGFYLMKSIDEYIVEVLITLALVMGGYTLALNLHISGPLAVVVMGLMMSDKGRTKAMSENTREYVDKSWELIDEVLNAVEFVLIGMEILVMPFDRLYIIAGIIAIVLVLVSRFVAVWLPISLMKLRRAFVPKTVRILTWGGLRGGISVALALTLTEDMQRELWVSMTYIVVIFSIIVQGLTIGSLVKRLGISGQ